MIKRIQRLIQIKIIIIPDAGNNRYMISLGNIQGNLWDKIIIRKSKEHTFRMKIIQPMV